jgi:hypothetical protein
MEPPEFPQRGVLLLSMAPTPMHNRVAITGIPC